MEEWRNEKGQVEGKGKEGMEGEENGGKWGMWGVDLETHHLWISNTTGLGY